MMPSLFDLMVAVPLVLGTFLTLVTGIGLLRLPDVYCRMHAAGKAGTLGVCLIILAAVVFFAPAGASVPIRGLLAIAFQFLTTPAATHLLARAAYVADYPLTERTAMDELAPYLAGHVRERFGKE
jgi:multicomponent Na+:H+ antiporter subunit G